MKHLDTILHLLDRASAGRAGSLREPLLKITELLGRKGIVVIVSDLYERRGGLQLDQPAPRPWA